MAVSLGNRDRAMPRDSRECEGITERSHASQGRVTHYVGSRTVAEAATALRQPLRPFGIRFDGLSIHVGKGRGVLRFRSLVPSAHTSPWTGKPNRQRASHAIDGGPSAFGTPRE